jgi:hypothetical protein
MAMYLKWHIPVAAELLLSQISVSSSSLVVERLLVFRHFWLTKNIPSTNTTYIGCEHDYRNHQKFEGVSSLHD